MSYQSLIFHREDKVASIDFREPVRDRTELESLIDELSEISNEIKSDNELGVVVITGTIQDSRLTKNCPFVKLFEDEGQSITKPLSVAEQIADLDRPIIMGIGGDAIGLGLELALACDIRIAALIAVEPFEKPNFGTAQIHID